MTHTAHINDNTIELSGDWTKDQLKDLQQIINMAIRGYISPKSRNFISGWTDNRVSIIFCDPVQEVSGNE